MQMAHGRTKVGKQQHKLTQTVYRKTRVKRQKSVRKWTLDTGHRWLETHWQTGPGRLGVSGRHRVSVS